MATSATATVENVTTNFVEQSKGLVQDGEKAVLQLVEAGNEALRELSPELQGKLKALDPSDFVTAASECVIKFLDLQQQYVTRVLTTVFSTDAA